MKTEGELKERIDYLKGVGSPSSLSKARELELVLGLEDEDDVESDMITDALMKGIEKTERDYWAELPEFVKDHALFTFSKQQEAIKELRNRAAPLSFTNLAEAEKDFDKIQELEIGKRISWKKLLDPETYKNAKKSLKKSKSKSKYEEGFYTRIPDEASDIGSAELIASVTTKGTHRPLLDIDFPAVVIPSSTPGHGHLYIDKEMPWKDYQKLLNLFAELGIIENGYRGASLARGYSALRLPWIKKNKDENPITLDF